LERRISTMVSFNHRGYQHDCHSEERETRQDTGSEAEAPTTSTA
jgi:hypothetical protein